MSLIIGYRSFNNRKYCSKRDTWYGNTRDNRQAIWARTTSRITSPIVIHTFIISVGATNPSFSFATIAFSLPLSGTVLRAQ